VSDWAVWRFDAPWALVLVLVVLPVAYAGLRGVQQQRMRFSSLGLMRTAHGGRGASFRLVPVLLRALVLVFAVLALGRPQGGNVQRQVDSEGVDIMLVLDTSGSMEALDLTLGDDRATRLEVAKSVVHKFIDGRVQDRIGLVVFGEEAFVQCPTTVDYSVLQNTLGAVGLRMAGDGTAIGNALGTAVEGLRSLPGRSKVVVLLTDGENTTGIVDPQDAAKAAGTYGIRVYTIGVGSEGEAPFLVDGLFGKQRVYQKVNLDEDLLRAIADQTGGRYFRADSTRKLEEIWAQIDKLERTEVKVREFTDFHELYPWALVPALLLLLAELVLRATWLRTLP
jgi:Ca-activated chloride channel family protein